MRVCVGVIGKSAGCIRKCKGLIGKSAGCTAAPWANSTANINISRAPTPLRFVLFVFLSCLRGFPSHCKGVNEKLVNHCRTLCMSCKWSFFFCPSLALHCGSSMFSISHIRNKILDHVMSYTIIRLWCLRKLHAHCLIHLYSCSHAREHCLISSNDILLTWRCLIQNIVSFRSKLKYCFPCKQPLASRFWE